MHHILVTRKPEFEKTMGHLAQGLAGIRTGRAHPGLVENISVMAYGVATPLKNLATISIPEFTMLQIEPWDHGVVKDIERALTLADLGSSPNVDGKVLRLKMPALNEESRKKMVKMMKEKLEEARVSVRSVREDVRHEVQKLEKEKEISEDERFKIFDELDGLTKEFTSKIDEMGEGKEGEIMTI